MKKRQLDIVILSDLHLGTYGCHADELLQYLKSIQPRMLVLNGDIIDIWQFSKRYFPQSHSAVLQRILKLASQGVPVYYLTGNHDDLLRRYSDFSMGSFHLLDKLVLEVDGKKLWIFHGDVFDASVRHARWLAKLGGQGYDMLILLNRAINRVLQFFGRHPMSFSKKIKASVKGAVKYIGDFEQTAAELAIDNAYDYVICGHIHQPQMKTVATAKGFVRYLNSGDWVENLTALEYQDGEWSLYTHDPAHYAAPEDKADKPKGKKKKKNSEVAEAEAQLEPLLAQMLALQPASIIRFDPGSKA